MWSEFKYIPFRKLLLLTTIIFIMLDSKYRFPGITILRWVLPMLILFLILATSKSLFLLNDWKLIIVLIVFFVASLYSGNFFYSVQRVISLILIAEMFFNIFFRLELKKMMSVLKLMGGIFILYEILNFIFLDTSSDRPTGITANANSLGIWSNIAFLFAVLFFKTMNKGIIQKLMLLIMAISVYTAIISGSRTYTLAILINIILVIWMILMENVQLKIVFLFLSILILAFGKNYLFSLMTHLPGISRFVTEGTDRGEIWNVGLNLFLQKPIWGWGYGISQSLNTIEYLGYIENHEYGIAFHNSYLTILIETGLVGFVAMIILLVGTLVSIIKIYKITSQKSILIVVLLLITMLLCFYGGSGMTSVGSTEGYFFWGLLMWIYVYSKKIRQREYKVFS